MIDFVPHKIIVETPDRYVVHLAKDGSTYKYAFTLSGSHDGSSAPQEARSCTDMDKEFLFATHKDPSAYLIGSAVLCFDDARYRKIPALTGGSFEPSEITVEEDRASGNWISTVVSHIDFAEPMKFTVIGNSEKVEIVWSNKSCNAELVINRWQLDKQLDEGTDSLIYCILYLHQANLSREVYL